MGNIILSIILGVMSVASFIVGYLQFSEKMTLLNNAYIYSSKTEREEMDKKPYYKQSGTIFCMVGVIFLINAIEMIMQTNWLLYLVLFMTAAMAIYAICSMAAINKNKK